MLSKIHYGPEGEAREGGFNVFSNCTLTRNLAKDQIADKKRPGSAGSKP